ncbi:hypothetical protein DFR58_12832 [Anaerobacterium chartisolvens]|uniref:Uncharacterized protein n=1 Tax=Anaerobacterium chartisolvens TaxID=1297424 RepID=A0A369ANA9_9FIRM|nr:hypothetical protein [Anaerobacterium chartisolvens]RCX10533.1 hypothetical protein DFR58_12832 [Anaerobacterium chartisolvens]
MNKLKRFIIMFRKYRYLILFFIVIILIGSVAYQTYKSNKVTDKELYFLNTLVSLCGYKNDVINVPYPFLIHDGYNLKNDISAVQIIEEGGLSLTNWQLNDGTTYKKYELSNIGLDIKIGNEGIARLKGIRVIFKNGNKKEYYFQDNTILGLNNDIEVLKVANQETYLSPDSHTTFDFKNSSNDTITLNKISFVEENNIGVSNLLQIKTSGGSFDKIEGLVVKPEEVLDVKMETTVADRYDLYLVRPFVEFSVNGKIHINTITNGTLHGLPISDSKMEEIYNRLIINK